MHNRVGFGKRLIAWLIDWVVIFIGSVVVGPMIGGLFGFTAGAAVGGVAGGPGGAAVGGVTGTLLGAMAGFFLAANSLGIVFGIWEALTGAALGKLLLGIRIRSGDGTPAPPEKLVARAALKHSGALISFLATVTGSAILEGLGGLAWLLIFVGCFFVLSPEKLSIHDRIAGTAVYPD